MSAANKIMSQRPSSYPAGLTHRIPKGAHISPGTELKKGDPRTRAIAIKARSHVKPRFRDTSIERAMQKGLSEKGLAFQTHLGVEGSNPDIIFADQKIAIFCDGDYWHNLPSYKRRDQEVNKRLGTAGWMVLRFWEHEIIKNVNKCIARVIEVIANRNSSTPENDPVVK